MRIFYSVQQTAELAHAKVPRSGEFGGGYIHPAACSSSTSSSALNSSLTSPGALSQAQGANSSALGSATPSSRAVAPGGPLLFSHMPLRGPLPHASTTLDSGSHPALQAARWHLWPPSLAARSLVLPPCTTAASAAAPAPSTRCVIEPGHCVLYWCHTDFRVRDNWALWSATWLAHSHAVPLVVLASVPVQQRSQQASAHPPAAVASFCGGLSTAGIPAIPCWHARQNKSDDVAEWLAKLSPTLLLADMPRDAGTCGDVLQLTQDAPCPVVLVSNSCINARSTTPACLKEAALPGIGLASLAAKADSSPQAAQNSAPKFMPSGPEITGMLKQELLCMGLCRTLFFSDTSRACRPADVCDQLQFVPVAGDRRATVEQQTQRTHALLQHLVAHEHAACASVIAAAAQLPAEPASDLEAHSATHKAVQHALSTVAGCNTQSSSGQVQPIGPLERSVGALVRTFCSSGGGAGAGEAAPLPESQWHQRALSDELAGDGMTPILHACQQGVLSPLHVMQQLLRVQAAAATQRRPERAMEARRKLRRCLLYTALIPVAVQRVCVLLLDAAWQARGGAAAGLAPVQDWFRWGEWFELKPKPAPTSELACIKPYSEAVRSLPAASHPLAACMLGGAGASRGGRATVAQRTLAQCLNRLQHLQACPISQEALVLVAWQTVSPTAAALDRLGAGADKPHPRLKAPKKRQTEPEAGPSTRGTDLHSTAQQLAVHVYT